MKNKRLENYGIVVGLVTFLVMFCIAWLLEINVITIKDSVVCGLIDFAFFGLAILLVSLSKSDTMTLYMKDERTVKRE